MMNVSKLSLLICLFFLWGKTVADKQGDGNPNCYIQDITNAEWTDQKVFKDHIKKTETNKIIFSSRCENITGVADCPDCFFTADITEDGEIDIRSNEKLLNVDDNNHTASKPKQIPTKLQFHCADGLTRILYFLIYVDDVNTHDPEFSQKKYEFRLPMPMPPGINLMEFGDDPIVANDRDFSNSGMTFTVNSTDLICQMIKKDSSTFPYVLRLEFKKVTRLPGDTTYEITAEDSGTPSRKNTTELILKIDENNSEPYLPAFTKPSFLFKYHPEDDTLVPEKGEDITLVDEGDAKITCQLTGDLKNCFDSPIVDGTRIQIKLKTELPQGKQLITITLSCYVKPEYPNEADVIVIMPNSNEDDLKFTKNVYNAKYSGEEHKHVVGMVDYIAVTKYEEDILIHVDPEYSTYFEVKNHDDDKAQWYLSKIKELDSTLLKRTYLNVFLELVDDENRTLDKAAVLLMLPNGQTGVNFTLPVFEGKYTFDAEGDGNLQIENEIRINSEDVDKVKPSLVGNYSTYFVSSFKPPSSIVIQKQKNLPSSILRNFVLPLTLEVEFIMDSISRTIQTVILLYLSQDSPTTQETSTEITETTSPISTTSVAPENECDNSNFIWIILVVVLCLFMASYIAATVLYYYKRVRPLRNDQHIYKPSDHDQHIHFQKKDSQDTNKFKDISTRRPTGFIHFDPDLLDVVRDEEVARNTAANKFVDIPEGSSKKISDNNTNDIEDIQEEPVSSTSMTLAEELKRAVERRENRLN